MKRISSLIAILGVAAFASTAANAADLRAAPAYKGPPPVVAAPYYNWTGFYIGAHIGGAWADLNWSDAIGPLGNHDANGFIIGGQLGYNWQTGPWVFGIEGQASWANLDGSHLSNAIAFNLGTELNSLGTLAGRVGYAWDRVMLYFKVGWAWANYDFTRSLGNVVLETAGDTRSGWMVGLGLEYGLSPNWSWKIEYNYMDFGRDIVVGNLINFDIDSNIHVVKLGVNYRFGGYTAPVVTRY